MISQQDNSLHCASLSSPISEYVIRDYISTTKDETVGELLDRLRGRELASRVVYFYVLDKDGKVIGVVPTRRLLMSSTTTTIGSIMVNGVVALRETASLLTACEEFISHRFLALPVVDSSGRMLGVVDVSQFTDEMADLAEQRSYDDFFQMIGVRLSKTIEMNPIQSFPKRFPWLLANILGGIACAIIASFSEELLGHIVVLALFIPVVLALSESVSIQSISLTVQRLHSSGDKTQYFLRAISREFVIALVLGTAAGTLVGLISYIWKGDALVSFVICMSIVLSMISACLLGVIFPWILRKLRLDPQVAAGPVTLALADIITLLFYLNLAAIILKEI